MSTRRHGKCARTGIRTDVEPIQPRAVELINQLPGITYCRCRRPGSPKPPATVAASLGAMTVRPRAPSPIRRGGCPRSTPMSQSMIEHEAAAAGPARSRAWWGDRSVTTKVLATVTVSAAVAGVIGFMGLAALDDAAVS